MDDRLDPRFAAAVRAALLDEVRAAPSARSVRSTRTASRRPRWQPVLALGIAAVTIVVITIGFSVASQTRSSPPASVPFDGDCGSILTARQATALIGKTLTLRPAISPLDAPEALAVPVVGGLECTWSGDGSRVDEAGLELTVLPSAQRPKDTKPETGCFGENDGKDLQYACNLDVVRGGRWITGLVTGLTGGTEARTRADVATLRRTLEALPAERPSTPLDRAGWWSPVDCTALGKRADLAAAWHQPKLTTDTGNGGMTTVGQSAALTRSVAANCLSEADTATTSFAVEIHAFGGASKVVSEQLQGSGARRLSDVGRAKVYLVSDEVAHESALWVLADGGALELLQSSFDDAKQLTPAVAPLLEVLDAHVRK
jgi:hypothetical protein